MKRRSAMKRKHLYPSYCCQTCGELIGWIGRLFQFFRVPLHRCENDPETEMSDMRVYGKELPCGRCGGIRDTSITASLFGGGGVEVFYCSKCGGWHDEVAIARERNEVQPNP